MPDYSQGKIYKIQHKDGIGKCYVGSTTLTLHERLLIHKSHYRNENIRKCTVASLFNEYGIDNFEITLLEQCNCTERNELHSREAFWIKELDCCNKIIPLTTPEQRHIRKRERDREHYYNHKDNHALSSKKWYEKVKDKLNEKFNCECGGKYTKVNILKHQRSKRHQEYIKDHPNP